MAVITKEQFNKLDTEDITKKEYDEILSLITTRVDEVWRAILKAQNRKLDWYDFQNGGTEETGPGYFDPRWYREAIPLVGCWTGWMEGENPFCEEFPTRFLWEENFLDEVKEETEKYKKEEEDKKAKAELKRAETKKRKAKIRKQIEAKLTKEELKYIKFQ